MSEGEKGASSAHIADSTVHMLHAALTICVQCHMYGQQVGEDVSHLVGNTLWSGHDMGIPYRVTPRDISITT